MDHLTLPAFSEVFPGWDLPKAKKNSNTTPPLMIGRDFEKKKEERRKEPVRPEFLNGYTRSLEMGVENIFNVANSAFEIVLKLIQSIAVFALIAEIDLNFFRRSCLRFGPIPTIVSNSE